MPEEHRASFTLTGLPSGENNNFEILAITAGDGNGWRFSEDCLKDSLPLWDAAQCFIDHSWYGHSIRDLAGILSGPSWDASARGVRLILRPMGPSAPLLVELGRQVLAESSVQRVGFSADLSFTSKGKEVQKILRIYSVDLVIDPARGGAFLRTLNSLRKDFVPMPDTVPTPTPANGDSQTQLEADRQAVRTILAETERAQKEAEAARKIRAEMCQQLLDVTLANAHLPTAMSAHVRKQFAGQVFDPAELTAAIDEAHTLVSDLTGGQVVQGPGRVQAMFNSADQLQAAVDDLLGAPREAAHENLAVHKLGGIRELYLSLTGDYDLHGGYYRDRIQLATTADFTGLVKNALNKVLANQWGELGRAGYDWWRRIVSVEHFNSLQSITGTLVGTVGSLPEVVEGAAYTELAIGDSPETATWKKYGGYIPLTLELIDRDETHKLRAYPRELAAAGLRKISALVAAIFTDNAGAGPNLADGGTLFNANAVTASGGHANLLTTALSSSEWEVASRAIYNQPLLVKNTAGLYGAGPRQAINPRYCLVPRALRLTAMKILYPAWENAANIHSENMQRGADGDVVVVPEWTDATDWAAVCDPKIAPAIFVGERFGLVPQIFIAGDEQSPAVFMNDEHRMKVRHFLAVWVNDFRPLHKSNVAG